MYVGILTCLEAGYETQEYQRRFAEAGPLQGADAYFLDRVYTHECRGRSQSVMSGGITQRYAGSSPSGRVESAVVVPIYCSRWCIRGSRHPSRQRREIVRLLNSNSLA